MEITAQMVKDLRVATNAGVLDCKKALVDAEGDFEKAAEILRERGLAVAAKKASREAKEGLIGHYIHAGGKVASLVEVSCETDFVARTDSFQELAHDLAMQVVAARPLYVTRQDVPEDVLAQERSIYQAQAADANRPPQVIERIVEGKVAKYYEEVCLMEQPFIKDGTITITDLINAKIAELGENIVVRRFVRFEVGENA